MNKTVNNTTSATGRIGSGRFAHKNSRPIDRTWPFLGLNKMFNSIFKVQNFQEFLGIRMNPVRDIITKKKLREHNINKLSAVGMARTWVKCIVT